MKNSICRVLFFCTCLIALTLSCGRKPAEQLWPQRPTGKFELTGWQIDTVFSGEAFKSFLPTFVNERVGYLLGENYGDLIKTTNGGTTWNRLSIGSLQSVLERNAHYYDIDFLDEETGFVAVWLRNCTPACRDQASMLTTRDGGTTWQLVQAEQKRTLKQIHFRTATEGVAVATALFQTSTGVSDSISELLETQDGGHTWRLIEGITPGKFIRSLYFLTRQIGFLQGADRTFYRTQDGGRTWETFPNTIDSRQFRFVTAQRGFATNFEGFFSTEDGGKTWTRLFEGSSELIGFPSPTESFFIRTIRSYPNDVPDFDAEVLRTTDGGQTWQRGEPVYNLSFQQPFQFPSSRVGFTSIGSRILRLQRR